MRSSRELPSHLRATIESMMVGEPIILLSRGLKAKTEDCRLLDDLACDPITDLSDDVFFDSAELEKVTGIDPYEEHLGRLMYLWLISNSPVSIPSTAKRLISGGCQDSTDASAPPFSSTFLTPKHSNSTITRPNNYYAS